MYREKILILTKITLNCSHLKNSLHKKKSTLHHGFSLYSLYYSKYYIIWFRNQYMIITGCKLIFNNQRTYAKINRHVYG